jgi:hypothetical protein
MIRQNLLCSNSKINGCEGTITQRGTILCETCTENRKNISLNKREYDIDQLTKKYLQCEQELSKYKTLYEQVLLQSEKDMNKIRLSELRNSQISIDNEKLIIDNQALEVLNKNLNSQLELLTKQNTKQTIPQTARGNRPSIISKIPELKRTITDHKHS